MAAPPRSARAGPGGDDVGRGLARVRDEALPAVEDPGAPVRAVLPPGRRPRAAGVGAGARLGQPVGADRPPARERHEVPRLLLVGPGQHERAAAERGVRGDDEAERAPHAPDLLDRDGIGERVHPGAAPRLGDRDAEPAHLADPAHDLDREAPLPLVLVDQRRDLGLHEVADGAPEQLVLGRKVEVHGRRVTRGIHGPAACAPGGARRRPAGRARRIWPVRGDEVRRLPSSTKAGGREARPRGR